jgi:hypothetical protein
VGVSVLLRGFVGMVLGMQMMRMGEMGVMSGGLVVAFLMMRGSLMMVPDGMFMVGSGFFMMRVRGFAGHGTFLIC